MPDRLLQSASDQRVDDRGRSIRLDHFADRIVSLSPHITELVFSAGAGGKLVGASRYSDFPEAAKSIPDVGDSSSLDLERIMALKPDLVIAWRSGNSGVGYRETRETGPDCFCRRGNQAGRHFAAIADDRQADGNVSTSRTGGQSLRRGIASKSNAVMATGSKISGIPVNLGSAADDGEWQSCHERYH